MKIFITDSLALCPYLEMNGLKYVKAELGLGKYDKPVVSFVFEDPRDVGRDLELDYMRSDIKRYRDLFFFFRNEIEKLKRRMEKVQRDQIRKEDDKYYE